MKSLMIALAVMVAGVALTGCYNTRSAIHPFYKVKYLPDSNGTMVAEAWVKSPSGQDCSLRADIDQNTVTLVHPKGRMALPDKVVYIADEDSVGEGTPDPTGYCFVSVYHLTDKGVEIDFYKRKFARSLSGPNP